MLKKGKDAKAMENYRGITVSGALGKLFEYSLLSKLNFSQSTQQFGFTSGLSPIMAGLLVSEAKAEMQLLGKEGLFLATLDSQKAFDVVHHVILLDKLAQKGVHKDIWLIVKNLYEGLTSKVKWIGQCSESFPVKQGVRQGGILSTHLYKIFIDDFLEILQNKRLGLRIGTVYTGSPACCDDVAFLTKFKEELQIMFNEAKGYSGKHRYEIHPTKTNVVVTANEQKVKGNPTWKLGENSISTSESAVHLGINRSGKREANINIVERISVARRTSYSLMNTGLHGSNGLSPEVSYQIYKTYVVPRLLYGLEIIPITKSQLEQFTRYHLRTLRNLQSLPQRTATSAVYMLLGALPIEAEIEKRQLSLLYGIISSENQCLRDLVERQLACSFDNPHSFFYMVTQVLTKYQLPNLCEIVTSNFTKLHWKRLYTKAINSYWTRHFVNDIRSKKSLCYLQTRSLRIGTVHSVWKGIETVREVKRCIVKARILTGTYTLQAHRYIFSGKVDPTCPHCQLEPEDLRHMLCRCPAFYEDRVASVGLLKQIIVQESGLHTWNLHFAEWDNILKVLVCPDFILTILTDLESVISKLENLARDYFYKIHVKRLRLQQKGE